MVAALLALSLAAGPVQATVDAVSAAARRNASERAGSRLKGDALGDHLVRAACAAGETPLAAMLGLAHALDPQARARYPPLAIVLGGVRAPRAPVGSGGAPTLRGSEDALSHFAFSAAFALAMGAPAAEMLGVQKELSDAQERDRGKGSGFDLAEIAVDLAGIGFAERLAGTGGLSRCARTFRADALVPPLAALRTGLTTREFERRFGSVPDPRFRRERDRLLGLVREHQAGAAR